MTPREKAAIEALRLYNALDEHRVNCECEGTIGPEACGECFPFADDARLAMRRVLAMEITEPGQCSNCECSASYPSQAAEVLHCRYWSIPVQSVMSCPNWRKS